MKKKSLDDQLQAYEKKCRKYRVTQEKLKEAIDEKNIDANKYFKVAFKYELLYSLKAAAMFKYINDYSNPFCSFFLRRFLEAYSILFCDYEGKLDDVNYRIFKASITKVLGKSESDKFKRKLKIKSSKHILELLEVNPYFFLAGATENEPSPFEILRNIETKSDVEEAEKEKILENYRITSCLIHYLVDPIRSKPVVEAVKKMYDSELIAFKKYLKEENKSDGKLAPETDLDEEFLKQINGHYAEFTKATIILLDCISNNENIFFLRESLYFFNSIVSALNDWFSRREYSYTLSIPKILYEKAPIYFEILNIKSVKEMQDRLQSFEYVMDHKIVKPHEELTDDEEIDANLKKIYIDFTSKKYIKGNYFDFKKNALENPAYLIFSKVLNFTDIANKFPKTTGVTDSNSFFRDVYQDSINYSHCYGKLIKEKEEDYFQYSITIAVIFCRTFVNYLDQLKKHPIIVLDMDADVLLKNITTIQYEISKMQEIYFKLSGLDNLE